MKSPSRSKSQTQFLCLVYFEGRALDALTASEHAILDRDSLAYNDTLARRGHLVSTEALQSPSHARTVSVRHDKTFVVDGPFAETKEQLGGFVLIRARSMTQAMKLAAGIPLAKLGRIEVRPLYHIPDPTPVLARMRTEKAKANPKTRAK